MTAVNSELALANRLIGGWTLRRWEIGFADGRRPTLPFGETPTGLIAYTPDGWMSATISQSGRQAFTSPSPRTTPAIELAQAFNSYFAYAGRWRVEGDEVVHQVQWAMNPGMAGTQQRRRMTFSGVGDLTLSADEVDARGVLRHHRISWRRGAPAA